MKIEERPLTERLDLNANRLESSAITFIPENQADLDALKDLNLLVKEDSFAIKEMEVTCSKGLWKIKENV